MHATKKFGDDNELLLFTSLKVFLETINFYRDVRFILTLNYDPIKIISWILRTSRQCQTTNFSKRTLN